MVDSELLLLLLLIVVVLLVVQVAVVPLQLPLLPVLEISLILRMLRIMPRMSPPLVLTGDVVVVADSLRLCSEALCMHRSAYEASH